MERAAGEGKNTMIVLHHCTGARSMRPLWTMEEMGIPYDLKVWPFPPRALAKDYLGTNLLGTVPYLIDGDVRMTESSGACLYLAQTYGPTDLMLNPGEAEWGQFLNWLFYSDATLTFPLTIKLRYTRLEPPERRAVQAAEDYEKFFLGRLRLVEAALEGRTWLVGGRFTIADIAVGYALYLADTLGLAGQFSPRAAAWYARLRERPAFVRAEAL